MAIIEESFQGFADLSWSLRDQIKTARAQREMVEELKQAFEAKLEKAYEDNSMPRKELCLSKDQSSSLETKLRKKKKKLLSIKATNKDLKKKAQWYN